jgi:membrane protein required for colicin V production
LENLNIFDIVTLLLIVLLGLKGLFRGFIKEVFALIGIVGGIFVASRLAREVGFFIGGFFKIDNESTVLFIGFLVSVIVFWGLVYLLGMLVSKMFSLSGLGILDRILGVIFGAGKIFLIFAIIFYALSRVDAIKSVIKSKIGNSFMYPIFVETGAAIIKMDTSAIVKKIETKVDETSKEVKEKVVEDTTTKAKEAVEDFKETSIPQTKE